MGSTTRVSIAVFVLASTCFHLLVAISPRSMNMSTTGGGAAEEKEVHAYAVYDYNDEGGNIHGVSATISIWKPTTQKHGMSIGQVWLAHRSPETFESLEVGWRVMPGTEENYKTEFFVFYTNDRYKHTNCYNEECPGFVPDRSSKVYVPGSVIKEISQENKIKEVNITIAKEASTKNWVIYADDQKVGHWEANKFPMLTRKGANLAEWGGEVVWAKPGKPQDTGMGSGKWFEDQREFPQKVASFRHVAYLDPQLRKVNLHPDRAHLVCSHPAYYKLTRISNNVGDGSFFYYGGPGAKTL